MNQFLEGTWKQRPRLKMPNVWTSPDVLFSSLAINILALGFPVVVIQVYDRVIPNAATSTLMVLMLAMLGLIGLQAILQVLRARILSWQGARFDHSESVRLMATVMYADTQAYENKPMGYYIDRMKELDRVQEFYSGQSMTLLVDFPFVVIFLALVWIIAGPMVQIPIALLALFVLVSLLMGQRLRAALEKRSQVEDRRQNFLIEMLEGIATVKSMAMESFMLRRYERLQEQSAESIYDLSKINSVVSGVGATFSQLSVVIFVGIGAVFVVDGSMTIGALVAGTLLSSQALQPGLRAMNLWIQFQSVRLAKQRVTKLMAMPRETNGQYAADEQIKGTVELSNVAFSYEENEQLLLHRVNLQVEPGEAIGITGDNGVGKSTLIRLLAGILQPTEGQIAIDGRNINDYDRHYLRTQIGVLPQSGRLFEGTILDNMTLYQEGEAVERAMTLAKLLGLDKDLVKLPKGLETRVGDSAVASLSYSVQQRIVLVRSLVHQPNLILFDDANANFDMANDQRLRKLLLALRGKQTMIIVSHRPSILSLCDRQFVLQNGALVQPAKAEEGEEA